MRAIEILQASLRTHIEWRDYFIRNPHMEDHKSYRKLGGASFHQERIDDYNEAILEIKQMEKELEELIKTGELHYAIK